MAATQKLASRDWADDDELEETSALPSETRSKNKDGTETIVSWRLNDAGQRVKTTRRIRKTVMRETVNPDVAARREWKKFGREEGRAQGPNTETTTVGENILFRPSVTWKKDETDETKKQEEESLKDKLRDKKVHCRICSGEHFTARCPYKDTMAPVGESGNADVAAGSAVDDGPGGGAGGAGGGGGEGGKSGGLGSGSGGYVPPHLRKGGAATGERMSGAGGGKFGERDDLATLRVTNVSEFAEEQELRAIFSRFGHVTRVFLAKDRETGRAKGFAFISYADRSDAARACEKLDGYGYENLILRVEFAKRSN